MLPISMALVSPNVIPYVSNVNFFYKAYLSHLMLRGQEGGPRALVANYTFRRHEKNAVRHK
jgi:hypothetical protein